MIDHCSTDWYFGGKVTGCFVMMHHGLIERLRIVLRSRLPRGSLPVETEHVGEVFAKFASAGNAPRRYTVGRLRILTKIRLRAILLQVESVS